MSCKVEIKKRNDDNHDDYHSIKINDEELSMNCIFFKLEMSANGITKITLELIVDELEVDDVVGELEINKKLIGVEPINNRHEILDL